MVRHVCAWIVMVMFALGLAAPALAQQAPTTAPPAKTEPAKPVPAKTTEKAKPATGTVKTAAPDSLVLVVGKDKKEMTFAVNKDTKVTKAGKAAKVADIAPEDSATVTYTEADGKMVAKTVAVKAKPKS